MKQIFQIIQKVGNLGINENTSKNDARHIQFSNYCSLISISGIISFCIFDSIVAFNELKEPIFISLLYIPLLLLTLYLNHKKLYTTSRNLLAFLCISLTFIIAAFYFGKEVQEHYLIVLFAGVALLMNPLKNWKTILFVSVISAAAFIYIELFVDANNVKTPYPSEYVFTYKLFTNLFVFFTFVLILVIYEIQLTQKEKQIEVHTRNLEEINKGLVLINEEVRMSHDLLVKMNSNKNQMFSIIAHDLRGPIVNILNSSDILSTSIKTDDKHTTEIFMDNILVASQNTYSLLEDLLTWATTQIDSIEYKPSEVNLESVIYETTGIFHDNIENKNISIKTTNIDVNLFIDENMIKTIMRNLISNAIKYSHYNGTIEILTLTTLDALEIIVQDYGVGMSEQRLQEFNNGGLLRSQPGTENERGTGFGLLICKELTARINGRIVINSTLGQGTEVTIVLPYTEVQTRD